MSDQATRRPDYDLAALRRAVIADRPDRDTLAALIARTEQRTARPEELLVKARARLAQLPPPRPRRSSGDGFLPAALAEPTDRRGRTAKSGNPREDRA